MALSKTKFKAVAAKLFAKASAGDLTIDCVFEQLGTYSPSTGQLPAITETITCIREEYNAHQVDGQIIQRDDFKLLAQYDDFIALTPRADGVTVTVDGVKCVIVKAPIDAADAVYTIQCRAS